MFDFIINEKLIFNEGGGQEEKEYLLSVKRMLPRWCNSIPDSEYLAIYDLLNTEKLISPYFVETGSGASTIVFFWFALKRGGRLYTWDTNGSKLFFLRTVIQDTILRSFQERNVWAHWCPVATSSTAMYAGISVLNEVSEVAKSGVAACFLDSEHTINNLLSETEMVFPLLRDGSLFVIDDSNYKSKSINMAYTNMLRKKIGLEPVQEPADNVSEKTFGESIEVYLTQNTASFLRVEDTYKKHYRDDLFWAYYKNDRTQMAKMGMEKADNLEHRFDAWRIVKK